MKNNLAQNCVLVNLTIRSWMANKQDSGVSEEVAKAKGVEDVKMGRYWKSLLPKCAEVEAVHVAMNKARAFHYANTLSYMHDGPRILPTSHYEAYTAAMADLRADFDLAVLALVGKYDELKEDAKRLMGSLYNELDYPDKNYVQSRYGLVTSILPMPASDSLMELGFDAVVASEMKVRLESELSERFRKNARAMQEQLAANLDGLLKTLADPKRSIRNESLDVSRRMAKLLPKLNVVGDRQLDAVCEHLLKVLDGLTHNILSTDRVRREKVAADLRLLRSTVSAAMVASTVAAHDSAEDQDTDAVDMSVARVAA
jgi:hypothetical protein